VTGRSLRLTAIFCILLQAAIPVAVAADVLVLKTGEKIRGTVANQGILRSNPEMLTRISILVGDDAADIRFYGLSEIDVVILEDGEERTVIDIAGSLRRSAPPVGTETEAEIPADKTIGVGGSTVVIFLGVGMVAVGALVDLSSDSHQSRGALNYVLMVAGGILVISGIASLVSSNDKQAVSTGMSPNGSYLLTFDRQF
jgi:hypothetical protein